MVSASLRGGHVILRRVNAGQGAVEAIYDIGSVSGGAAVSVHRHAGWGIGVGFAGGAGVIVLSALGATPGDMPMLVIVFIMVVIVAIAAMQEAGGIEYLVDLTERLLRRYPRLLVITAPLSTWLLTMMASTGQVSFACMPVIVGVAKENNIKPTRALALSVSASLLGIVASPISAAVIFSRGYWRKGMTAGAILSSLRYQYRPPFLRCWSPPFLPVLGQNPPAGSAL
jgi:anaerobic C4-dicarboxylate transporter DcuA